MKRTTKENEVNWKWVMSEWEKNIKRALARHLCWFKHKQTHTATTKSYCDNEENERKWKWKMPGAKLQECVRKKTKQNKHWRNAAPLLIQIQISSKDFINTRPRRKSQCNEVWVLFLLYMFFHIILIYIAPFLDFFPFITFPSTDSFDDIVQGLNCKSSSKKVPCQWWSFLYNVVVSTEKNTETN